MIWTRLSICVFSTCYVHSSFSELVYSKILDFGLFDIVGRTNAYKLFDVGFSIKLSNTELLEQYVNEVSYPLRTKKYLSRQEVGELVGNPDSTSAVLSFLAANDISAKQTLFGEIVLATTPIYKWEKIFNATFYDFRRIGNTAGGTFSRALNYTIPSIIAPHLAVVLNVNFLSSTII